MDIINNKQYIFTDDDFEDNPSLIFNPNVFVSRYSQIISLESLKDQLINYCNELKHNLYLIINRDYQDFINIATKLEGVDYRVDHLRKPLVDLRLDLANLHDGMVASIQNIHDKLKRKSEISNKRLIVESTLLCIEKLEIAESILDNKPIDLSTNKSRRILLKSKLIRSDINMDSFATSELERAAYSLKHANEYLSIISTKPNPLTNTAVNSNKPIVIAKASNGLGNNTIHHLLVNKYNSLLNKMIIQLSNQLTNIFNQLSNNNFPIDSYIHCIRALITLDQNHIIEEIIANLIVIPLGKSLLTQGRIDGSTRGSYSGLDYTIDTLVNKLIALLQLPIQITDKFLYDLSYELTTDLPIDILVKSVWYPIIQILIDRFPTMLTIAISNVFSICYNSYSKFKIQLCEKLSYRCNDSLIRLSNHVLVKGVDSKWSIDVYYHVRSNDLIHYLDSIYEFYYRKGLTSDLPINLSNQLTNELNTQLYIPNYHISLFKQITIELVRCLQHDIILNHGLSIRFANLCIQVVIRLEAHVCIIMDITTLSFNKETLNHIQQLMNELTNSQTTTNTTASTTTTTSNQLTTPTKTNTTTPSTTPAKTQQQQSSNLTIEEMVLLASDIHSFIHWFKLNYNKYLRNQLIVIIPNYLAIDMKNIYIDKINKLIDISMNKLVIRFIKLRDVVWNRAMTQIASDCKKHLTAVKVIAGKYRMTNKPPPDSPSSYVELILQPFKSFIDNYSHHVKAFTTTGVYDIEIIEDITKAYIIQIQQLMETVKQMDSALQRRTKLRTITTASNTMTDSEKISLQVLLDIKAYYIEICKVIDIKYISDIKSYNVLLELVNDTQLTSQSTINGSNSTSNEYLNSFSNINS